MQNMPCRDCGAPVAFDPIFALGNCSNQVVCQSCIRKAEAVRLRTVRGQMVDDGWKRICPAEFLDTEFSKLPKPKLTQAALDWGFEHGHGLNLWGVHDTGKTRTLYLVIERFYRRGKSCRVFSPADFMAELERRAYHRSEWVQQLARLDVVAFDDIDKLCLTKPQEAILFAVLDKRMTKRRPCLFTHNSNAAQLEYKFKTGGASLVRRIRDFTHSIHFGAKET